MKRRKVATLGFYIGGLLVLSTILYLYFPQAIGEMIYPINYEEQIVESAKEFSLEPSLVAAIIFTESRFNKDAVSRVGARGLMQIMPATARSIANDLGVTSYKVDDLYTPSISIRFGSYYIKKLINNYDGNVNAALAAYNGGGSAGDRYVVSRDENLGWETKGFIKTVNGAKEKYEKLYANRLSPDYINVLEKMKLEKSKTWYQKLFSVFQF